MFLFSIFLRHAFPRNGRFWDGMVDGSTAPPGWGTLEAFRMAAPGVPAVAASVVPAVAAAVGRGLNRKRRRKLAACGQVCGSTPRLVQGTPEQYVVID